jgi:hypothetical protein
VSAEATSKTGPAAAEPERHPRKPRRRWARGVDRPEYMRPGDIDRVMVMLVALVAEVSSLRDRLDTHEAVAELGGGVTTAAIEAYELTPERRARRETARAAMLHRVLRAITEEREAALESNGIAPHEPHPE